MKIHNARCNLNFAYAQNRVVPEALGGTIQGPHRLNRSGALPSSDSLLTLYHLNGGTPAAEWKESQGEIARGCRNHSQLRVVRCVVRIAELEGRMPQAKSLEHMGLSASRRFRGWPPRSLGRRLGRSVGSVPIGSESRACDSPPRTFDGRGYSSHSALRHVECQAGRHSSILQSNFNGMPIVIRQAGSRPRNLSGPRSRLRRRCPRAPRLRGISSPPWCPSPPISAARSCRRERATPFLEFARNGHPLQWSAGSGLPGCGSQAMVFKGNDLLVLLGIGFSLKLIFGPYVLAFPAAGTPTQCNQRQKRCGNELHAAQMRLSHRSSPLMQPPALRPPASAWRISSSCSGELCGIGALGKPASRPWSLSAVLTFAGRFG